MFASRASIGRVRVAFTDRHGGTSRTPYESLNLGRAVGDADDAVDANFARLAEALGTSSDRIVLMRQRQGIDVAVIDEVPDVPPTADALLTTLPDTVLCVRAADCAPVLLVDAAAGIVAAVHAGRAGMAAGVVPRTAAAMREQGAQHIVAVLGPRVCGACYEVPAALQEAVVADVPQAHATTRAGTPALDIGAGLAAQLESMGIEVDDVGRCTVEHDEFFSYRRDGPRSGRQAGLVWLAQ